MFTLPSRRFGQRWKLIVDTTEDTGYPIEEQFIDACGTIEVPARSTLVLKQIEPPVLEASDVCESCDMDTADVRVNAGVDGTEPCASASRTSANAASDRNGSNGYGRYTGFEQPGIGDSASPISAPASFEENQARIRLAAALVSGDPTPAGGEQDDEPQQPNVEGDEYAETPDY